MPLTGRFVKSIGFAFSSNGIFLGERLKIEAGGIVFSKKIAHIDHDIITTPTFIIQDILRETVTKYCKDKTGKEIINSSFTLKHQATWIA